MIASALSPRDQLDPGRLFRAETEWQEMAKAFYKVVQLQSVGERAVRLLRTHRLKAADALQLAAALIAFPPSRRSADLLCLYKIVVAEL